MLIISGIPTRHPRPHTLPYPIQLSHSFTLSVSGGKRIVAFHYHPDYTATEPGRYVYIHILGTHTLRILQILTFESVYTRYNDWKVFIYIILVDHTRRRSWQIEYCQWIYPVLINSRVTMVLWFVSCFFLYIFKYFYVPYNCNPQWKLFK